MAEHDEDVVVRVTRLEKAMETLTAHVETFIQQRNVQLSDLRADIDNMDRGLGQEVARLSAMIVGWATLLQARMEIEARHDGQIAEMQRDLNLVIQNQASLLERTNGLTQLVQGEKPPALYATIEGLRLDWQNRWLKYENQLSNVANLATTQTRSIELLLREREASLRQKEATLAVLRILVSNKQLWLIAGTALVALVGLANSIFQHLGR